MDRASLEKLLTPITAASDPTSYSIRVAVLPEGVRPGPADWHPGEWVTRAGVPYAVVLVGPGSDVVLEPGVYRTWTEIAAAPEKPIIVSGRFSIT